MSNLSHEDAQTLLARVGEELSPRREGLARAVGFIAVGRRSPLFITSSYMSTHMKVASALVAVVVVLGGAYYLAGQSGDRAALLSMESADGAASKQMMQEAAPIPEPTGSFDDFAAAIDADISAQLAALESLDADVDGSVSSVSSITTSQALYDPNSL